MSFIGCRNPTRVDCKAPNTTAIYSVTDAGNLTRFPCSGSKLTVFVVQSAFYDGLLVFDRHPFVWIVDKFFYETIGISWSFFRSQVSQRWVGSSVPPFDILERDIYKVFSALSRCKPHGADVFVS